MNTQTTLSFLALGSVCIAGCLEPLSWDLSAGLMSPKLYGETIQVKRVGCRGTGQPLFGDFNLHSRLCFPSSTASFCPAANERQRKHKDSLN